MFKRTSAILAVVLLTSCSSSHDMSDGDTGFWGGGFQVKDMRDGVYFIKAQTNVAPFKNIEGARSMWAQHAENSCGKKEYEEKEINEYTFEKHPPSLFGLGKYIISVREGLAVCD